MFFQSKILITICLQWRKNISNSPNSESANPMQRHVEKENMYHFLREVVIYLDGKQAKINVAWLIMEDL